MESCWGGSRAARSSWCAVGWVGVLARGAGHWCGGLAAACVTATDGEPFGGVVRVWPTLRRGRDSQSRSFTHRRVDGGVGWCALVGLACSECRESPGFDS